MSFEDLFSLKFFEIERYLQKIDRFYVPTDRKLYSKTHRDAFDKQLKESLFGGEETKVNVFTGSEMYEEILKLRTKGKQENEALLKFEDFLGKKFFEGKEVFFAPEPQGSNPNLDLKINIGGEGDLYFYQLGEGIQSLIIISYLSRFKDKALIAIEEPENNLHPGLQKKLVEVLLDNGSKDNMILATTHSNHFLEYLNHPAYKDKMAFFRVEKLGTDTGQVRHKASKIEETEVELLDQLGVSNRSVFLANSVIWVEGISDVMYLRRYLEVYKKSLEPDHPFATMNEGLHYAFAFSGGNLLAHITYARADKEWEGIDATVLSNRMLVITDEGSKNYFKRIEDELNENYLKLGVREIENTLSQPVVHKIVKSFSTLKDVKFNVVEDSVWVTKGMGYIIDKLLIKEPFPENGKKFSAQIGPDPETATIGDKTKFAEKAVGFIEEVEDLSDYTQKTLLPRMVDFILQANGKNGKH